MQLEEKYSVAIPAEEAGQAADQREQLLARGVTPLDLLMKTQHEPEPLDPAGLRISRGDLCGESVFL